MQRLADKDPRLVGPYRITALLGAGGMGRVYLGLDPDGGSAAVKVARAEYAYDPDFRERFARELDLARRVHGAHTPRVLDADTSGQAPWLATEYVMGPSLHDLVQLAGPLPESSARFLARGVAQALERVHANGLVHHDLKPGNVMVSASGPQVIDFGIARAMEEARRDEESTIIGTPGYMAPEIIGQARGGTFSDVFALAGVIVYALTGTGPFGEGHPSAVMYRITTRDPVLTGVPESLRGIVGACLDKDPRRRPTATQVLHALGGPVPPAATATAWLPPPAAELIDGISQEYRAAVGTADRAKGSGRRGRRLAVVGAASAALLLTAGVGTWAGASLLGGEEEALPEEPGQRAECDISTHIAPEYAEAALDRPDLPSTSLVSTAFSADGNVIAAGGTEGLVLWDWREGVEIARIEAEVEPLHGAPVLSPDGCRIGYAAPDGAHVYVIETGEHTVYQEDTNVSTMTFSGDSRSLLMVDEDAGSDATVLQVDLGTDEITGTYDGVGSAQNITVSPDGTFVGAINYSGDVKVWDTESGEVLFTAGEARSGHGNNLLLPNDDGDVLYMAKDWIIHQNFVEEAPSRLIEPSVVPENGLAEIALNPQADRLYASYTTGDIYVHEDDEKLFGTKVWEFSSGDELTDEEDEGYLGLIAVHPEGEVIAGLPFDNRPLWIVEPGSMRLLDRIG